MNIFLAIIIILSEKEKRKNTDAAYNIGRNGTYVQHPVQVINI